MANQDDLRFLRPNSRVLSTPTASPRSSYEGKLRACYEELAKRIKSRNVEFEVFYWHFVGKFGDHGNGADKNLLGAQDQAGLLEALLLTFTVEIRDGYTYLHLSRPSRMDSLGIPQKPLEKGSDVNIRVTECFREREFIRVNFHLKENEAELSRIQTFMNLRGLGGSVSCSKGRICAAPYMGPDEVRDGETPVYARAVLLDHSRKDRKCVRVRYIDFGSIDFVERAALRNIKAEFLKTPALALKGVVINSAISSADRQSQATRMRDADEISVRVLKYDRKLYQLYVHPTHD
ncbi:uncharacterized protein LOC100898137 [Galendromus occidentalis]|uniref:Uncharacterized protein LOC100898137 n=1 Tax=Galendromus occidentalis TaxID=34638 RepID=A0AAJ7PA69_9ACAR|nr:uncharacterized protein LOC100898137 [Galendromus occidentalis]XP_018495825.1 uncharacterized protein LOC100898137 [Galendromus occidentalis]